MLNDLLKLKDVQLISKKDQKKLCGGTIRACRFAADCGDPLPNSEWYCIKRRCVPS